MKFHEMTDKELNYISAYEENCLKINNKKYSQSIIVLPNEVLSIANLSSLDVTQLIKDIHKKRNLELIIVASKDNIEFTRVEKYKEIISMQIGIEFMKLESGYRTYNITMSELREAALIVVLN
ncbi:MAG: hypothetical protein EBW59_04515 [Betaproteobacteria bacterium]|jgi:uncharacterized protein|nr:hypothetical protein [Nitrosomonadales bacterium]NCV38517.1 hypothetical protein [Betaproteobacteria bacterium]NCV54030.1 hypothetical protein [Betaproteobacteria bacterium]NCX67880.1 hypothetical protein [Betaproteobacteria bacterium]